MKFHASHTKAPDFSARLEAPFFDDRCQFGAIIEDEVFRWVCLANIGRHDLKVGHGRARVCEDFHMACRILKEGF